jgi:hypothetical protein
MALLAATLQARRESRKGMANSSLDDTLTMTRQTRFEGTPLRRRCRIPQRVAHTDSPSTRTA